jgi:uncharacterized protein (DUF488 family)
MKFMPKNIIFSIGHSNLPIVNFCIELVGRKINILVDIRTKPFSRWNPQYNRSVLEHHLNLLDISYIWKGQNLGGLAENINFNENIKWLADLSKTERVVVLCSEKDYRKCHRHLLIEPELLKHGVKMEHI